MNKVALGLFATAMVIAGGLTGIAQAEPLTRVELEGALSEMQRDVDEARDAYASNDPERARNAAARLTARFALDGDGASALEDAIKAASAAAVGDRVKALTARFAAAIDAGADAAVIDDIADELGPSLNRLVIIAAGRASAASARNLRSVAAIDGAIQEVTSAVERAVTLALANNTRLAVSTAKDAFFAFEINDLGPDTSAVDDDLENRAENMIVNFDARTAKTDPGLAQLIEARAPASEVRAKADAIIHILAEIGELLKATLPPTSVGDANGDGRITIVDALFVAQAALGLREKTDAMDANRDGRVTIVDALFIAQAALGIRSL